ncbi:pectinesterase inhibitor-like [Hordeum vulgare subsp. vulgare]|uniref:Pectinesterase inhibitor domain-containing protein n=1 Tax=Hordeum vulgare subsp. vulgare TaxID=112509 RepID=A0A8I6WWD0_HORVV|nr:pectinesterase inhibitor-like [Hordeum vulgare subsp. vulgare]
MQATTASTSTFVAIFPVVLAIVSSHLLVAHANTNVISRTCNKTKNPALCISVLTAKPQSSHASTEHDLASIALKIATNTAKHNVKVIGNLSKNNQSTPEGFALAICLKAYTEATSALEIYAGSSFKIGSYTDVLQVVSFAMDVSYTCKAAFTKIEKKSPVSYIDREMKEHCTVASNLINLLVHK